MLPKKHRLAKALEVKATTARGRSFFNPYAVIKYQKNSHPPRFTVIVSTKVSKKAVVRNRVKRVVREIIHGSLPRFAAGDYAVIMKAKAVIVSATELRQAMHELFIKTHLIK